MNVKNNKRKQESTEKIRKVLFEFLKTKEINQIKVTDICKAAGINRSTFYSTYTDIYDLADKILTDLENEVRTMLELETDWNKDKTDFLRLFEHMKANQELYSFYFKLGYDNQLKLYNVYNIENAEKDMLEYHIEFFKNGFNSIVKMWLKNGCKETPQRMCDILLYEYRGRFETE